MTNRQEWLPGSSTDKAENRGSTPEPEQVVDGRYRVIERLGSGGMGIVYRAQDVWLDRTAAIKIVDPSRVLDASTFERFQKEARSLAQVRHDNVVQIYAFGPYGGAYYFAMEHVDGKDLALIIEDEARERRTVPLDAALEIVRQIGRGLSAVHERQIVHRDVKPSNVIIENVTGRPVLIDFGLARRHSGSSPNVSMVAGTPSYMAPEQSSDPNGYGVTHRSDIYALACTTFELLSGRPPFQGRDAFAMVFAHLHTPAPALSSVRGHLAAFDDVILRAMAKRPHDRFESCAAFLAALDSAAKRAGIGPGLAPNPALHVHRMRVLVFEPNEARRRDIVRIADRVLRAPGDCVEIECVENVRELANAFARDPANVVIVDDENARTSTEDVVVGLRHARGGAACEIIVLVDEEVRRPRLHDAGACELPKPVNMQVLGSTMARMGARIAERRRDSLRE